MPEIFISYARETEAKARQVTDALRALGYAVWRDDDLPAHRDYAQVIEERLRAAKAVVVVWSAEAAKSQGVLAEADVAREAGTLVQLSLDGAVPPLPFNRIQCADLAGWTGDPAAPGWRKVLASLAALTGGVAPIADARSLSGRVPICVLPFANMSGDIEQEYFSDGITEDIITDLSKVSALSVVARNTAFTFKGQNLDIPQVARQLGVSHVLEGSVRKAGGRVRITAQLIDGAAGDHVWAERYDRDLDDIFALQDEISQAIVAAMKLKLLPEEKRAIRARGTTNLEAYELYLMAREHLVSGDMGGAQWEEAILRLCYRAVELDPNYANAWALIARAQSLLKMGRDPTGEDGTAAAERALSLDPALAEPHATKAYVLWNEDRNKEAHEELDLALRMDPESDLVNGTAGLIYYRERRFEEAIRCYSKMAEVAPTHFGSAGMLITSYQAIGDQDGARRAARMTLERADKALARDRNNGSAMGFAVGALVVLGQADRAREWMSRALLIDPDNGLMRYNFACCLCSDLKDHEAALEVLGPSLNTPSRVSAARTDPDLDPLRDDPRFQALLAEAEAKFAASS
jgi:adenylate cyclase